MGIFPNPSRSFYRGLGFRVWGLRFRVWGLGLRTCHGEGMFGISITSSVSSSIVSPKIYAHKTADKQDGEPTRVRIDANCKCEGGSSRVACCTLSRWSVCVCETRGGGIWPRIA